MVTYLLNGLDEKFDYIINVIKHKEPFPSFETVKSMLYLEESRLKRAQRLTAKHSDHSSSTTALTATTTTEPDTRSFNHPSNRSQFNSNNRGNRKNRGSRGGGRNNFQSRPNFPNWATPPFRQGPFPSWPNYYGQWPQQPYRPSFPTPHPPQSHQQAHLMELQPAAPITEMLADPTAYPWIMDSGATAHLSSTTGSSNTENSSPL
ncbi:PREDICTED: uncharacterized protein LOC109128295 isoform X2 [Camelina sativa]|uniref:Uncharacterized protein LOC109128295 isoform X2 n=1 Tax=Camelina sativa TaxID=90675 RepID=A0ABM1QT35_CAMSA|nr:PREDICTED: uncharacterized protein LOC109128295 isoform X2 [Camelina sativa]